VSDSLEHCDEPKHFEETEFGWITVNLLRMTLLQGVSLLSSCIPKDYWIKFNFYWFCVDITCPAPHTLLHFIAPRILFKKSTYNGILLFLFRHLNVCVILGCQSSVFWKVAATHPRQYLLLYIHFSFIPRSQFLNM